MTCAVLLNSPDCEALPGNRNHTRTTCYRCGNAACRADSEVILTLTATGPRRRARVCTDCQEQDKRHHP